MRNHPPHFPPNIDSDVEPVYSADGRRIAFRSEATILHYFDGNSWQRFSSFAITGSHDNGNALGPPWCSSDGSLMFNTGRQATWRMDGQGKWASGPFQSHYPNDMWSEGGERHPQVSPPHGCVTKSPESCVQDNLGTYWLTWKGHLYHAAPGHCVPVFSPGEANPFTTPQQLWQVFLDSQGNALIESFSRNSPDWYIVRARTPPPHTTIALKQPASDSFLASLDAHTTATVTFRAKLDDGPWQDAETDPVFLEHLPNGPHVLQVEATDDQLNTDPAPARVDLSVHVDPAMQMTELLAELSDADYDMRKRAVAALALQPVSMEAALRKARETASDEQQWWIDVALQEIEARDPVPANL